MKDPNNPGCRAVSEVLNRVGDKWSVLIVVTLAEGSKRFNELRREIPSISQRMLTLTLRGLERDGLVSRTVTPSIPPRVDYELTELGRSLQKPVEALANWAIENIEAVYAAQERFDAVQDAAEAA
jgi:DNA-binding HxlR family transcriptional regulator